MSLPGHFVELEDGMRLFVHERRSTSAPGEAPVAVLLHGYLDSHYGWRKVIPALVASFDVVALDLPGFGESDRPTDFAYDVPAFADVCLRALGSLGIARCVLVGHSLGGATALAMAASAPERVTRVAALAPAVYQAEPPPEAQVALAPLIGPFLFKHLYSRRDLRRILERLFVRDRRLVSDDMVDYFWDRLNRAGAREAAWRTLGTLYRSGPPSVELPAVRCPVLLLWGEEDVAQPVAYGRRLAQELPDAELSVLAAAGHLAQLERPAEVSRRLMTFLNEHPRVAAAG